MKPPTAECRDYAVLLVAYGTPNRLEDVEPYLLDVRGGRPTSPALVAELTHRYAAIGGHSPLLERTREQASALATSLGGEIPVYVGMRHWHPYIGDVLAEIRAAGHRRLVAVPLAPHYSRLSIGAYRRKIDEARDGVALGMVSAWFDHPRFLDAVAEKIEGGLRRFEFDARDQVPIIFTAHSLPHRILADGDPYPGQLAASIAGVLRRVGNRPARLAYQSAGRSDEPWLGPDAAEVLAELAAARAPNVLLCPIGFVSDHLEVLYDVDIEYQALARRLGIRLERTESLNSSPLLIEALADLVRATAQATEWP